MKYSWSPLPGCPMLPRKAPTTSICRNAQISVVTEKPPGMLESFSVLFSLLSIPENRGCGDVTTREVPAFPGEPRFPGSLQPKQLFEQECVILEYFPVKTLIFPLNRTNAGCAQVQEHHNKALNSCMEMGTVNFGSSSCIPCASSGGIPNSWL